MGRRYREQQNTRVLTCGELWEKMFDLFAPVLYAWQVRMLVSLHRPPCGCFFRCKNGLSHIAYIFGAKLKRRLVQQYSSGISACPCAVVAAGLCMLAWMLFSCCVRHREESCMCQHLFPGQSVFEMSSVASCGCVKTGTSQRLGGMVVMTTQLTPASASMCCASSGSRGQIAVLIQRCLKTSVCVACARCLQPSKYLSLK